MRSRRCWRPKQKFLWDVEAFSGDGSAAEVEGSSVLDLSACPCTTPVFVVACVTRTTARPGRPVDRRGHPFEHHHKTRRRGPHLMPGLAQRKTRRGKGRGGIRQR